MLPEQDFGTARVLRRLIAVVSLILVVGLLALRLPDANAALPVGLGTAESFAVLAGQV